MFGRRVGTWLALLLVACAGCGHRTVVNRVPPDAPVTAWRTTPARVRLQSVALVRNGTPFRPSREFVAQLTSHLRAARLFAEVEAAPGGAADVDLVLVVNQGIDTNETVNTAKRWLVGPALELLVPATWSTIDYDISMVLDATRWDGQTRRYVSDPASTTAQYQRFADVGEAGEDAFNLAVGHCLNGLLRQMAADSSFYESTRSRE